MGMLVVWQRLRRRKVFLGSWGDAGRQVLLGVALGVHWWAYFEAIKVSNVGVSLVALKAKFWSENQISQAAPPIRMKAPR